jgi:chromosome segregation ATPase
MAKPKMSIDDAMDDQHLAFRIAALPPERRDALLGPYLGDLHETVAKDARASRERASTAERELAEARGELRTEKAECRRMATLYCDQCGKTGRLERELAATLDDDPQSGSLKSQRDRYLSERNHYREEKMRLEAELAGVKGERDAERGRARAFREALDDLTGASSVDRKRRLADAK